jgi:signal transduction histidine kinase
VTRLPIRLRLTVTFAAVMVAGLAIAGFLFYLRFEAVLNHQIDGSLRTRANVLAAQLRRRPLDQWPSIVHQDVGFAQALDRHGRVIAATPSVAHQELLNARRLPDARRARIYFELGRLPHVESQSSRVLAQPVGGATRAIILTGEGLHSRESANESLAAALLVGGPLALLLACGAGYGLAAAALRPVESMRSRAATISAEEPGARLPIPPAQDELRRLGITLNAMLDRLEGALERERAFVADASHELRTPLAVLMSEVELALRHERSAVELRAALRATAGHAERLRALAEDLLTIARGDQPDAPVRRERVDIREVVTSATDRVRLLAADEGRTVRADRLEDVVLLGDPIQLEQALVNLLDNALHHGSGDVQVLVRVHDGLLDLAVRDDGPGPPPDFRARIFDRFSRAPDAHSRPGAGLGLAIVAASAAAHGGRAEARDTPDGKFEVALLLPITHPPDAPVPQGRGGAAAEPPPAPGRSVPVADRPPR